jgi:hypothetical protein
MSPSVLLPGDDAVDVTLCGSNLAHSARDVSHLSIGGLQCAHHGA